MSRRELDQYFSPEWATEELLKHLNTWGMMSDLIVFEPCSGQGGISNVLKNKFSNVKTNDIDPSMPADTHHDAALKSTYSVVKPGLVITNPPFSQALDIIRHSVTYSKYGVAALLRISFLEPTRVRGPWLEANPPKQIIVLPRISFTGDGKTDSVTCAWMIWDKLGTLVPPGIKVIPKKD